MKDNLSSPAPSQALTDHLLLKLVDNIDAMLAYWDANQTCVFANAAYQEWFGRTREEMIGITLQELLGPLYPRNLPYIKAALAGEPQLFERDITTPDGTIRHSLANYIPHIENGKVLGMFVHVANVTPMKKLEHELMAAKARAEKLATHDYLTGLPNRVLLIDRIIQAMALSGRRKQLMAVLTLDIDDFKQINDTHGHAAGDELLIEIANRLKGTVRLTDTVTRMGGDEFLILAPLVESVDLIEAIARRMLERVREPLRCGNAIIIPTFSLGIALYPDHGVTPEELIRISDQAMYTAKNLGKNCYKIHESGQGPGEPQNG